MARLKIPTALAILVLAANLCAQERPIIFDHISLEHGLSQSHVTSIVQDHKGFLWFGTADGLNQFDGYGFTVYKYHPHQANSLPSNYVTAVFEDRAGSKALSGTLWVGTSLGLSRFDRNQRAFTNYRHDPNDSHSLSGNAVTAIHQDRSGALWIGTMKRGINKLVIESDGIKKKTTFIRYQHDPSDSTSLSHDLVTAIYEDRTGTLWIGTEGGGLNRLVRTAGSSLPLRDAPSASNGVEQEKISFVRYQHDPARPHSISSNLVSSICEDHSGNLWIGTYDAGLNQFDRAANAFRHYKHLPQDSNSLGSDSVTCLFVDKSGALWIGTDKAGLHVKDRRTNGFRNYKHDSSDPRSISSNFIWSIYQDRSGVLWIATTNAGLNKFNTRKKNFNHYRSNPATSQSAMENIVFSICEDPAKRDVLWIGSAGGLDRFDRRTNSHQRYRHEPRNPSSLSHNAVWALYAEVDSGGAEIGFAPHPMTAMKAERGWGKLWIGTQGGLNCLDIEKKRFVHYRHDPNDPRGLSSDFITAIRLDKSQALWIGTLKGLHCLDRESGAFTRYPKGSGNAERLREKAVYAIIEDAADRLWIGTNSGLIKLERDRENFSHYDYDESNPHSLSHSYVSSLYFEGKNRLWIGTYGGGLNRLDLSASRVLKISQPAFAPAQAMAESLGEAATPQEKFVHFTEEHGLVNNSVYGILGDEKGNLWLSTNRGLSKFDLATASFKNYDVTDGLQSYEFNAGAYFKSQNGEMFFGGINGFNSFYSDSIKDHPYIPPVVLTDFKKFGKSVPLHREISETEHLTLSYQESFSFEFVALDYTNPPKNQYAYRLEGFDPDWIHCGSRRYASYTNLNPGDYVFRVKGSNSDGVWNEAGAVIEVTIHPPFWRTWWFALFSSLSLIGGIVLYHIHSVKRRIRHVLELEGARMAENERVRKQVADDFHDELGQKLTHILLYSELLKRALENSSEKWPVYLSKISAASQYLAGGIRNFIWSLDPEQDSLYHLAIYLKNLGDELFHETGVLFRASAPSETMKSVKLPMHWRRHLTFIVKEGMSNILKHAACQHVELTIALAGNVLTMTLADDGGGFDSAKGCVGGGIRKMKWSAANAQGTLEVISTVGKGTIVQFQGKLF